MPVIERTNEFSNWLRDLRDLSARAKAPSSIDRLAQGNPGDVGPVGDGVSELRIPTALAIAFIASSAVRCTSFCSAAADSQVADIRLAKKLASELED